MKNRQKKILIIYGTRPEAVKLAPVILSIQKSAYFEPYICITGQHREMVDQVNQLFKIYPDFDLDVMQTDQSLSQLSVSITSKLPAVLEKIKPDWVLVQGDTTTALISSLVAYYHKIKVAHIEAGLRTFNKWEPFPEEINRHVLGVIADLHFAPTEQAKINLINEGVSPEDIVLTGNTIVDALNLINRKKYDLNNSQLVGIPWERKIVIVTAHRRENLGKPLENICEAIRALAETHRNIHFVFPLHRNPNVEDVVRSKLGDHPLVTLLPPIDYHSLIVLLKKCSLVMTDSGGIQEEALTCGKPFLILRNSTERPEVIKSSFALLTGTDPERIIEGANFFLNNISKYDHIDIKRNPFGDGKAAQRIIKAIKEWDSPLK